MTKKENLISSLILFLLELAGGESNPRPTDYELYGQLLTTFTQSLKWLYYAI